MNRHKWIDEPRAPGYHRAQTCANCVWSRQWIGGRFQMWEYYNGHRETFIRPDCVTKTKNKL